MKTEKQKPWYKKKRYIIPVGAVVALGFLGSTNTSTTPVPATSKEIKILTPPAQEQKVETSATTPIVPVQKTQIKTETKTTPTENLSNDNYYTNSAGNQVHSPAYSNTVPAGASARCRDGTYSFSQNRRGTCSHHGGVVEWL